MSPKRLKTSSINQGLESPGRLSTDHRLAMDHSRDLAVIGLSCRLPGAPDAATYWNNLEAGVNSITEIPGDRWDLASHYSPDPNAPGKSISKWGGFIQGFDLFDNQAFGISDREARYMDPQQRVLLETAWHAIEDAAIDPRLLKKRPTGVFVGVMAMDYYQTSFAVPTESYSAIGNYGGILANRISYHWGLEGASMAMDTACASSLVALHEARRAILSGELDYGVVGAVSLNFHPWKYISFSKSRMLSPDGQCKTFDKNANGYVPGEGVAAIVVCPVSLALDRGHRILGVVKATAVGHTGASSGITAPRVEAQMGVISAALAEARVSAETISYVEAHGTGTSLGDPIEIEALTRAYREQTGKTGYCRIGSVKTNIGHLEAVAGLAGLIKILMMFKGGSIPRHLNLKEVNPIIDFASSPFKVADTAMPWEPATHPLRRAALSSFGFGGVNSHAILEEPDPAWAERHKPLRPTGPLVLAHSAVTPLSFENQKNALAAHFEKNPWPADGLRVSENLLRSRSHLNLRWGAVMEPGQDRLDFSQSPGAAPGVLFLEDLPPESLFENVSGLGEQRRKILEGWKSAPQPISPLLEELAGGVALFDFLTERVHPTPAVSGKGKGLLAAYLAAGLLNPKDFSGAKGGRLDTKAFGARQALGPIALAGKLFEPLNPTAEYLAELVAGFKPSGDSVARYRHLARQLLESQFTFKKLLADWAKDLAGRGIDLDALIADGALPDVEKMILIGVVRSSMVRLNRKWNLSEKDFRDPVALEWANLLSADLLSRKDFLDLLAAAADLPAVAGRIKTALEKGKAVSLPLLVKKGEGFDGWEKAEKIKTPPDGARVFPSGEDASRVFLQTCVDFWAAGRMESLADLHQSGPHFPCEMPPYPFDRRRFWLDQGDLPGASAPSRALAPSRAIPPQSEAAPDPWQSSAPQTWNRVFNPAADGIVGDHEIAGVLLVPGAAMIEMGLRAGDRSGAPQAALADIQITAPGVVGRGIELKVARVGETFSVTSAGKVLTQGKYASTFTEGAPAMPATLTGLSRQDNGPIYREFAGLGYHYGPTLQVIRDVSSHHDGVGARLESPAPLEAHSRLNPALLDGLFQMVLLALGREAFTPSTLYVPFGLGRLTMWRPLTGSVVAYLPKASVKRSERETRCDLLCWTPEGEPILAIRDMVFRQAPKAIFSSLAPKAAAAPAPVALPGDLYFVGSSFVPRPLAPAPAAHGLWFMVGDGSPADHGLAAHLPPGHQVLVRGQFEGEAPWDTWALNLAQSLGQGHKQALNLVVPFTDTTAFADGGTLARLGQRHTYFLFDLLKALAKRLHSFEVRLLILKAEAQPGQTAALAAGGLAALCRTALLENRKLKARVLEAGSVATLFPMVASEMAHLAQSPSGTEVEVRYGNDRQVRVNHRVAPSAPSPFRKDGVYLIAGGAGGIGLRFCEYLAGKVKAVGLLGRSHLPADKKAQLEALSAKGTTFSYERADLTDGASIDMAVSRLRGQLGPFHGVFHSGGHLEDGLLMKKTREAFAKVYDPKVLGAWALHQATLSDPLDVFCVFSSIVSVMGNMGQADYAAANGFLDHFARWRQASGFPGQSQSVNWTLWQDGGMGQTEAVLKQLAHIGIAPLHSSHALPAYEKLALSGTDQCVVVQGDIQKLTALLQIQPGPQMVAQALPTTPVAHSIPAPSAPTPSTPTRPVKKEMTATTPEATRQAVLSILSGTLGTPADRLEGDRNITEYGADSVLVMELADKLAAIFGDQVHHQTVLDHPTVDALTAHLVASGLGLKTAEAPAVHESPSAIFQAPPVAAAPVYQAPPQVLAPPVVATVMPPVFTPPPAHTPTPQPAPNYSSPSQGSEPDRRVAVIGMAGRFPESPNLEVFWEHLLAGRDLITEVPKERFDISPWLNSNIPGLSTYTKRAGVVRDIEWFDNGHFRIKDEDARLMDPQQRIFMEIVQECLDRAGYYNKDIAGTQTAVFVGAGETEYARRPDEKITKYEGKNGVVNTITNLIASRVSDYFDLRGPSWTVHTACSSSLIAVHNACQSILSGESDLAIAGGTEFFLEESFFIGFSNSKVLSPDAKCHTFDKKANGFAMGEGVGAVLLKPYGKALADGDRIYGVILSTAANNDGKTMGLTTPNIHAQKQVIKRALDRGQINPDTISYFEAHGTGTYLGDPIEVKAASEVYRSYTQAENYCAIGSVKTNMGHSLMASGVMSLLKVLLCLKEKTLVPTLHCDEPHPGIGFGHLPFYPNTVTKPWEPRHGTRRAAISSFGFGGTNAHVIVEQAPENYKSLRETLPPRQWNRKRLWVDGEGRHNPQVYLNPMAHMGQTVPHPAAPVASLPNPARPAAETPVRTPSAPVPTAPSATKDPTAGVPASQHLSAIRQYLVAKVAATLKVSPDSVGPDQSFLEMGLDSMTVMELTNSIQDDKHIELYPTLLFEYTSISDLAAYLHDKHPGVFGGQGGDGPVAKPAPLSPSPATLPAQSPAVSLQVSTPGTLAYVKERVASTLKVDPSSIGDGASFLDMGLDSMTVMELTNSIQDDKHIELYPTLLFEYTNPKDLAAYLDEKFPEAFRNPGNGASKNLAPLASPQPPSPESPKPVKGKASLASVKAYLKNRLASTLKVPEESIGDSTSFLEMGLDSMTVMELTNGIQDEKHIELYPTLLFEYTNVNDLAQYLLEKFPDAFGGDDPGPGGNGGGGKPISPPSPKSPSQALPSPARVAPGALPSPNRPSSAGIPAPNPEAPAPKNPQPSAPITSLSDIAIVGMAGKFPQSENLDIFWQNLVTGKNLIREVPPSRWDWKKYFGDPTTEPNKTDCRHGGFIDGIDQFDPLFFGISPREAHYMDPQQRLFIEAVWEAVEDSGHAPSSLAGRKVGLFAGVSTFDYAFQLDPGMDHVDASIGTGVAHSTLVNRISYLLDLRGPSESVDTACSSALVALHNAVRAIHSGDCEIAIAGGVNISSSPMKYITFSRAGMLSKDGQCKTFDKDANGYVPGEGVGAIVLKPLAKALADGNRIHAVLKGTAVNHGGHANSLTSPNPVSQAEVIRAALSKAKVGADTISYIEAHGTGTKLGDPIEINGLKKAFAPDTKRQGTCRVGSVKTNIGHLEAAAGMAGLLKVILALKHRTIPASLNFKEINPFLELKGSPFLIARATEAWPDPTDESGRPVPRRGGVSSFGFGGTNAHVILEEAAAPQAPTAPRARALDRIYLLSAKYPEGVRRLAQRLHDQVLADENFSVVDGALTTQTGRDFYEYRAGFMAENRGELLARLSQIVSGEGGPGTHQGQVIPKPPALPPELNRSDKIGHTPNPDEALRKYQGDQILALWVQGTPIPWATLNQDFPHRTVSLPNYPFNRKRYWITDVVNANRKVLPEERPDSAPPSRSSLSLTGPSEARAIEPASGPRAEKRPSAATPALKGDKVEALLREKAAAALYLSEDQIDIEKKFVDLGLDSILAVEIMAGVNKALGIKLPATKLYDYPTIKDLSSYILENYQTLRVAEVEAPTPIPAAGGGQALAHTDPKDASPAGGQLSTAPATPIDKGQVAQILRREIAGVLYMKPEEIDGEKSFIDLGLDSILAVEIVNGVNKALGIKIPATKVYDYPNINLLAGFVATLAPPAPTAPVALAGPATESVLGANPSRLLPTAQISLATTPQPRAITPKTSGDIAIIGMAGQFPGAPDLDAYWKVLAEGRCTVKEVPPERWDLAAHYDPDPKKPGKTYCRHLGVLDHADEFDPLFFEISPKEAELMDPQQRLFLRTAWEVLENAGYANKERIGKKKVGVYVGVMNHDYAELLARRDDLPPDAYEMMGNSGSILAARISYILDLKGPSLTVDTACSSSLVASHLAIQSLLSGECEMALAGGVTLYLSEKLYILMSKAGMLSPTGRCHTFDNHADGFVPAEGVGAVLLKPLEKALADGDVIHAVIKGSGVNQDGKTNGITAPSALSQTELELSVYAKSGLNPETFGLMEAHGTGTKLGDPIEVSALTEAWQKHTPKKNFCALGSAKSNLGHTSAAAGMAALMKVVLAMKHGQIPPSVLYEKANEHIDFASSPFYVPTQLSDWKQPAFPRRAAVSAFGFSGTNAHLVVEEPPAAPDAPPSPQSLHLAVVSARRLTGLHEGLGRLARHLEKNPGLDGMALSHTLLTGRQHFARRVAFLFRDSSDLYSQVGALSRLPNLEGQADTVLFNFSGATQKEKTFGEDQARVLLEKCRKERADVVVLKACLEEAARRFVSGHSLPWDELFIGLAPRRLALPTYAFDRGRFWLPPVAASSNSRSEAPHPLLGEIRPSLDGVVFNRRISPAEWVVDEHRVAGKALLPGAAMAEMGRAAAQMAGEARVTRLDGVSFLKPVTLVKSEVSIKVTVVRSEVGASFRLSTEGPAGETLHAQGQARFDAQGPSPAIDPLALEKRLDDRGHGDALYPSLKSLGLDYGPSFQPITRLWGNDREAFAHLSLAAARRPQAPQYVLHPALLDGALQVVSGIGPRVDGLFLPVGLGSVVLFKNFPNELRVFAEILRESPAEKFFRITIADENGIVCAVVDDFCLRRLGAQSPSPGIALFAPTWKSVDIPPVKSLLAPVLLLSPNRQLTDELRGQGHSHLWWDTSALDPAFGGDCHELSTWKQFLSARQLAGELPKTLWIQLPGPDADARERERLGVLTLYAFSKTWLDLGIKESIHVVVAAFEEDPYGAACGGFIRSLSQESTRIDARLLRLPTFARMAEIESAGALPLASNPFRELRQGQAGFEVRSYQKVAPAANPGLPKNQVVFITGGTGGLGMILAEAFLADGQSRVALVGRRAPQGETAQALGRWGERALFIAADMGRLEEAEHARRLCLSRLGSPTLVIHSAGVLRDGLLGKKTPDDFKAVLAAKVLGLENIASIFGDTPVVAMSSVASVAGNVGQTDYGAANAFMDHMADHRPHWRAVNWGLWAQGGMTPDDAQRRLMERAGLSLISNENGLSALAQTLGRGPRYVFVAGREEAISKILQVSNQPQNLSGGGSPASEKQLGPVVSALTHSVAQLLKVPESEIHAETPLSEYGVDSVMAMMLKDQVSQSILRPEAADELQVAAFMEHPSLAALARHLIEKNLVDRSRIEGGHGPATMAIPPRPAVSKPAQASGSTLDLTARTRKALTQIMAQLLKVSESDLDGDTEMAQFGVDSVMAMMLKDLLTGSLLKEGPEELQVAAIMEYPTVNGLGEYLVASGQVDGGKLDAFERTGLVTPQTPAAPSAEKTPVGPRGAGLKSKLIDRAAMALGVPVGSLDGEKTFEELGFDGVSLQMFLDLICGELKDPGYRKPVYVSVIQDAGNINKLAQNLVEKGICQNL